MTAVSNFPPAPVGQQGPPARAAAAVRGTPRGRGSLHRLTCSASGVPSTSRRLTSPPSSNGAVSTPRRTGRDPSEQLVAIRPEWLVAIVGIAQLVGPISSDLARLSPIAFDIVAQYPLVLPSRPHGLRAIADEAAAKAGIRLNVRLEADTYSVLKEFAISGSGFTILPASSVERETREGLVSAASLAKPRLTRQLVLASPPGSIETRAIRAVLTVLKEEIGVLIETGRWQAAPMGDLRRFMGKGSKSIPMDTVRPAAPANCLSRPLAGPDRNACQMDREPA